MIHAAIYPYQAEKTVLGHYKTVAVSGLITGTGVIAGSPLFSLLWNPAPITTTTPPTLPQCVITRLSVVGSVITAFGSALEMNFGAYVARGITVANSGGTALTPFTTTKANYGKARTSMGPSLMSDMRIAATGILTVGTRTLDANPFAVSGAYLSTAAPAALSYANNQATGEHPLVLAAGEGIEIQPLITFTATGTVRLAVTLSWAEVPHF